MTVSQLIEKLKTFPPNAIVVENLGDLIEPDFYEIEEGDIKFISNADYVNGHAIIATSAIVSI